MAMVRSRAIFATVAILAPLFFVGLPIARAEDGATPKKPLFSAEAKFSMEFNVLNSGSARTFVPFDVSAKEGAVTHTGHDVAREGNYNAVSMRFFGPYAEVSTNLYARHDAIYQTPKSIGLSVEMLFPLRFLSPDFRAGFCHESAHNLDTEKLGDRGTDMTGACGRFRFREGAWRYDAWGWWYFVDHDVAPVHVVTNHAGTFRRDDLGFTKRMFGIEARSSSRLFDSFAHLTVRADDGGPKSASAGYEMLHALDATLSLGGFIATNHNFHEREKFGGEEMLLGAKVEIHFGK